MTATDSKVTRGPHYEASARALAPLELSVPPGIAMSTSSPRALVADDDPVVIALLQRILTRKGFEVATARDGEEAWVLANSIPFDVVLTDLEMPRASGLELFDGLRASKPELPFIFVTGQPTLESAVDVMNKGAIAYLQKPFEPQQVLDALERASKGRASPFSTRVPRTVAQEQFGLAIASLHLHYQPIVCWSAQNTYSYEALLRTSYSEVPHPGAFLDLAEGLGKVRELGREVRRRAALDVTGIENAPETVFINLHPEELSDDELFDKESPLAKIAKRVCLEITERESLRGMADVLDRIRALKNLGFRIAIDDIGAGYSGLNSFVDLEPDLVKIDMGLVRGIDNCERRQKLVRSLLDLARDLEIDVVAEGVETSAELSTLLKLKCDLFQGYLFSRPDVPFPEARLPPLGAAP